MKQYTDDRTAVGGMNLDCLILSPAFAARQPRLTGRESEKTRRKEKLKKPVLTSGDRMLLQVTGLVWIAIVLSVFC